MDRTVIVTGGSRGIGRRVTELLVEQGMRVAMVARDADVLKEAAAALPADRVLPIAADVTVAADVTRMVAETVAWGGRIDVLVNNAGIASTGPVESFPPEVWSRIIETNLTSVFLCSKAVTAQMKRQRQGLVVNVVSGAGIHAFPHWSAYCASKFAVVGFSRAFREEVRMYGIRVSLLYPGSVDTPLWETFPNTFDRRKMLTCDDVARATAFVINQPPEVCIDDFTITWAGGPQ